MYKFRLEISTTHEIIGYEYLTIYGWENKVFDYEEREGTFDQRELGDGFYGTVNRQAFVTTDHNGNEMYEGDILGYQLKGGVYLNTGQLKYDRDRCSFVIISDNELTRELPLKSECIVFALCQNVNA